MVAGMMLFLTTWAYSQQFQASAGRSTVADGERFQVRFSISAEGANFHGPSFKGFTVLSGPNANQNITVINGRMSSNVSYSYILQADKEGSYQIDPATIQVNGQRLKSNSLKIKVVKSSSARQGSQGQANAGQGRGGSGQQGDEKSLGREAADLLSKNLFIRVSLNKNNTYQGEQVTAIYKIYVHPELNIVQMATGKVPPFSGFWAQDIDLGQNSWKSELVNGVPFKTAEIKKVVLVPQQSGRLTIEPYEMNVVARLLIRSRHRSDDFFDRIFDDPFFGGNYKDFPYTAKSQALALNVKPLPKGAPAGYSGAVGDMKMDVWLDKSVTRENEPVTLKIKISGRGNLKLIDKVPLSLPPSVESYDPKVADNLNVSADGISGNKVFEYLLIPRVKGEYKINPVEFTYFDPGKGKYITLRSNEFKLKVEKGTGAGYAAGVNKEEVTLLGKDIRFIKTHAGVSARIGGGFFGSFWFILLLALPLLLLLLLILMLRKRRALEADSVLYKNRKATGVAMKRLARAKKMLGRHSKDEFYEETTRAMWGYLADKLSIKATDLTKDKAREALTAGGAPAELADKLLATLDACEFARYAPATSEGDMAAIYNDAASVITEIEGKLR